MDPNTRFFRKAGLLILFVIGLGLIAGGGYGIIHHMKTVQGYYVPAKAQITQVERKKVYRNRKIRYEYNVRLRYEANGIGQTAYIHPPLFFREAGDEISIVYDPENPQQVYVPSHEYLLYSVLLAAGISVCCFSLFLNRFPAKKKS